MGIRKGNYVLVISFSQEFPVGNSCRWFYRASMPDVGMASTQVANIAMLAFQRLAFNLLTFKFLTLQTQTFQTLALEC